MFTHGGTELAEKISRDSQSLGGLITQHLAEFDRTVKVYGGELVERLSQRTEEVTDSMRSHVDNFDSRVGAAHHRGRDRRWTSASTASARRSTGASARSTRRSARA